jgi:hypothetical protein
MRTRIAVTALVTLVAGALVMYLSARPLEHQSTAGLSAFSWPIVVVPAVGLGVLFGLAIGLLGRRRTARRGPVVAWVLYHLLSTGLATVAARHDRSVGLA